MPQISPLFARQPIFDRNRNVVAYELLFRSSMSKNSAGEFDGDKATAKVLLNGFGEHNIEELTNGVKAYVNFTRNLLINPPHLPKNKLVVEVLENIEPDDVVIAALERLKKKGYSIAMDDFLLTESTKKFVKFSDYIKIDVLQISGAELEKHVKALKRYDAKLIAEKVETHEVMEHCLSLGFDLFQGYFLCKPEIVTGVSITESKQSVLKLISLLNKPEVEIDDIVKTIAIDPALSYKVLRLVNSPAIGLQKNIESLKQAVTLLGLAAIRNWSTFLLMANNSSKPRELSVITMCRAKFCEILGTEIGGRSMGESCFTVGLLSNIDAFIDIPMSDLVKRLNLASHIQDALLKKEGEHGRVLQMVTWYERGLWGKIDWDFLQSKGLQVSQVNMFYGNSIIWATQMVSVN